MVRTRKKVIKTVFKDEDDSDAVSGDFSDSGSEAVISDVDASSEDDPISAASSEDEFQDSFTKKPASKKKPSQRTNKINFTKLMNRMTTAVSDEEGDVKPALFSVKDMTESDKLLPSVLNLSESDSSDDESLSCNTSKQDQPSSSSFGYHADTDDEKENSEYKDVWSKNLQDDSEEIAQKTFLELEQHKTKIEEAKASVQKYSVNKSSKKEVEIKDLLAQGEELPEPDIIKQKITTKKKKARQESDSEVEDWEEVDERKTVPSQGLQLIVDFPDAANRKVKKVDVEMMMRRKINRVKKEYQVYMHKVHVLSWIGHGNYVSKALNDQDILSAVLSLVPSKECYPGERVDMKYVEQITTWFKDKLTLKQDKNEDKFRPKAPPLKEILLLQIKNRAVTAKKYLVYIFVALLRAMGLQCRVMLNFVTLPIKPPSSELCSLSTKDKEKKDVKGKDKNTPAKDNSDKSTKEKTEKSKSRKKTTKQIDKPAQIMQLDGNDDTNEKTKFRRQTRSKKKEKVDTEDTPPPKKSKIENIDSMVDIKEEKLVDKINEQKNSKKSSRLSISRIKSNTSTNNKKTEKLSNGIVCDKETIPINRRENEPSITKVPSSEKTQVSSAKSEIQEDKNKEPSTSNKDQKPAKSVNATNKANKNIANIEDSGLEAKKPSPRKTRRSSSRSETSIAITRETTHKKSKAGSKTTDSNIKETNDDKKCSKAQEPSARKSRRSNSRSETPNKDKSQQTTATEKKILDTIPEIKISDDKNNEVQNVKSEFFENNSKTGTKRLSKRSHTAIVKDKDMSEHNKTNSRSKSAPNGKQETSKYFNSENNLLDSKSPAKKQKKNKEDSQRVSHRDLKAKSLIKTEIKKNDVTGDLVDIIKMRVKQAKAPNKSSRAKNKTQDSDDDDYLPEENINSKRRNSDSDMEFKPTKVAPKPKSKSDKIDRRVLSPDEETPKNKIDIWCEVFVEELEQWIAVDVIKAQVHCTNELYNRATHPVAYVVGWDNNNYLKDLTQRYVPHWNTVTRKLRVEPSWWETAIRPWRGPKTARDKEEDEQLERMQMEAPLPKSIGEYKNHPLYALKRHLLKFEAIYPPDAATLGFIRNEPVYARDCVYVCRSRDIWLKEAKVVKMGEKPYKIVKARPKWDRLSNKMIDGRPLEIFGPWQTQDYEPPTAENGIVPRNAYGNVELFKTCMLPKGTVHMNLPGLARVAKKLNIDCAPAMTGFEYSGGYSHPVYDGFVVCKEFEEELNEAWLLDQEEQERKENEKLEARVYGNWKKLIKGLLIRERLKYKYGFEEPTTSEDKRKSKGPSFVAKKRK